MASSENAILEQPGGLYEEAEIETGKVPDELRRVLIVGGGVGGLAAARELRGRFRVTVVDPKEYYEYSAGILRAYVDPCHWDSITFCYKEVLERVFGVGFIWGEVISIDGEHKHAHVKAMFAKEEDVVPFDYCIIASGCNFNPTISSSGESPWFPVVHGRNVDLSEMRHLDERYLEGRRRRILEEHRSLVQLNSQQANVLINGAGIYGVEWACELQHAFPKLQITVTDFLPHCLGPLTPEARTYCEAYMKSKGIRTFYTIKLSERNRQEYFQTIGLPNGVAKTYVIMGVKQSNYFMPKTTLSEKGPSQGDWILLNKKLQVVTKDGHVWGDGSVFVVGNCSYGCVMESPDDEHGMPPVPKTGYTAEQQAIHAAQSIRALDRSRYGASDRCCIPFCCIPVPGCVLRTQPRTTWYPWGSGIFAISLGPNDGCFIVGANHTKNSGRIKYKGQRAAAMKELIETTKVAQCRGDHRLSSLIWYLIHHWPCNCVGKGPLISCC